MESDLDVEIKEEFGFQEDMETFFRSNSPVNLHSVNEPMMNDLRNRCFLQNKTRNSISTATEMAARNWYEELDDLSLNISRQTRTALGRIRSSFAQSGLKFNADFRECFFSTVNNRWVYYFKIVLFYQLNLKIL